ncbi:hypothetical protein K456DRAFT_28891 [Colletotrichum gloeosporioides 23]|nr:hypothetical protein K456DRAFT_28891 [Colletotrichum gloeosporioides 23]
MRKRCQSQPRWLLDINLPPVSFQYNALEFAVVPQPLVIKPSGSLDLEFVSHPTALSPKEILHKTSQVDSSGAEKALHYTAQTPHVHLVSTEPVIVVKKIILHELDQGLPTSAKPSDELLDGIAEEVQAVPIESRDDKTASASNSTDRLDNNASTASLPTGNPEEDTAGVLTPIGANRPMDHHWEYSIDTKTGQVCFKRAPGPPEPWVISKELVLNMIATGQPEPGSNDAQAWDEYNKKLR